MKGGGARTKRPLKNRAAVCVILLSAWCAFLALPAGAQPQRPEPPLPVDPTPIDRLLSPADKASLAEADNPKKVIDAYMRISDGHLQSAFNAIKFNDNRSAERELDIYNKALTEAGKATFALLEGKRGAAKKIEQGIYRQIKVLESIERLFPSEREAFATAALRHAKQLRVQALNEALSSGGGVLKEPDEKPPDNDHPQSEEQKKPPESFAPRFLSLTRANPQSESMPGFRLVPAAFRTPQQPGDYLTEEEDDHVREAQAADARVKVFMKIADRRIRLITGTEVPKEQIDAKDKKDQKKADELEREWGTLPKLSRAELLRHYAKAINECMAKLDDAYERNPKSTALPKALSHLREATDKHLVTLRGLAADMKTDAEKSALREAIGEAEIANNGARQGLK